MAAPAGEGQISPQSTETKYHLTKIDLSRRDKKEDEAVKTLLTFSVSVYYTLIKTLVK